MQLVENDAAINNEDGTSSAMAAWEGGNSHSAQLL